MKKKKVNSSKGKAVAVGAGVIAVAAATYFLFGPNGKKNRKSASGWMMKMKGEVIEQLEKLENITEPVYQKVVDKVAKTYAAKNKLDSTDLKAFAADLKKDWKGFAKGIKMNSMQSTKKAAKKVSKKAKKVAKK